VFWKSAESLPQDLRFAMRLLARNPAFTAVAVLTIGLGIGATTAVLSLVDTVFLRPLPVAQPAQLVALDGITARGEHHNISYPLYQRLRDGAGAFSGVLAALDGVNNAPMRGTEPGAVEQTVRLQMVSGEYFRVLGAPAHAGRTLTLEDNQPGRERVAVLSHAAWNRHFGGDPGAIGRRIEINRQSLTIIGVTRAGFFGESVGRAPDVWVPLAMQPLFDRGASLLEQPNTGWLRLMARLRPGVTGEQATAALSTRLAQLKADPQFGKSVRHLARIELSDGSRGLSGFRERYSLSLRILAGVVGILLLIHAQTYPACCWPEGHAGNERWLCDWPWARGAAGWYAS
jgi:hypothetical protein